MKDLTALIKKAFDNTEFSVPGKYSKSVKNKLKEIENLNSPGLYIQVFKNEKNLDIFDANGHSTSSHQRPKITVFKFSSTVKPGKSKNGVDRIIGYAKHMNMPNISSTGVQPNPSNKKEVKEYEGISWYNSGGKVYSESLSFFGWIPLDSDRTAEELEKIWNNSVTDTLNGNFKKSTFGKGKGHMSESLTNVEIDLEKFKKEIIKTACVKIGKIYDAVKLYI
tara:strand:+ start:67 stop:732 length:666 start_codon:yes stop_codon:yes gene_type:complete